MAPLANALTRLYARIPLGIRLGLGPMYDACRRAGHPERAFPAVHVAGTNGKGSACAMVESIARAHGLRTGLYTSPHLCRFAERIRIDGEAVGDDVLEGLLSRALEVGADLSFFETATLAALLAFHDARVDLAVLEVGIGGRLDATNVIPTPRAAAITRIALDHTDRLGSTLVEIAREKAGIAKPGLDLALGPMAMEVRAAIDEVAHAHGATTSGVEGVRAPTTIGLPGAHQLDNARIATVLGERIGASASAIERGIASVRWPGRLERIDEFLLDAAHNPDGAESLATYLKTLAVPPDRVALVFGTLADKDWRSMLAALSPHAAARYYVAPHGASRATIDPDSMRDCTAGVACSSVDEALALARGSLRKDTSLVVVAGSLVLVGEARARLLGLPHDPPVAL